jgi:hypothetical protein
VLLGKMSFAWLKTTMEALICKTEMTEFIKLHRYGNKVFIVLRCSNMLDRYLEVAEYEWVVIEVLL